MAPVLRNRLPQNPRRYGSRRRLRQGRRSGRRIPFPVEARPIFRSEERPPLMAEFATTSELPASEFAEPVPPKWVGWFHRTENVFVSFALATMILLPLAEAFLR